MEIPKEIQEKLKHRRNTEPFFDSVVVENRRPGNLDGYDCSVCRNKGYIARWDERKNLAVSECACMEIRRSVWRLRNSGLKDMAEKYTLDNFKTEEAWQRHMKDMAERFIASNDWNWFFAGGQVGAGKSHICTAVTNALLKQYPAQYMLWRDEVNRLKANLMDDAQYHERMNKLKCIKVLYIDDFLKGAVGETISPSEIRIAFELINYRYNNPQLVTILSSEKTIGELMGTDEATASRILERCGEFVLNISRDERKNQRLKGGVL